jgi:MSHA biogenesis protein MshO
LVEAVVVIAIVGTLAAMAAMFMRNPLQASFDVARRADLTDIADTALRRMARDVQSALPNSMRVSGSNFMEFVPIKAAGRYRAEVDSTGGGNPLDFSSSSDASFDVLGPGVAVASGDAVVIYNLGIPGADVYEGTSRRAAAAPFGGSLSTVTFAPGGTQFPFASPGSRFHVIVTPVTYACDVANGRLWRYSGYAIQSAQPASIVTLDGLTNVTKALLASKVSACSFVYSPGVMQRNGLATIRLSLTDGGETVTLMHQVNVTNTP